MSCLHGPHQGAQKSTSTGWRLDSSITSFMKPCVVVSFTTLSAAAVTPPPFCSIFPRRFGARPQIRFHMPDYMGYPASRMQSGQDVPAGRPDTRSMRGTWPVDSRNFTRSSRLIEVVMVLTSGW